MALGVRVRVNGVCVSVCALQWTGKSEDFITCYVQMYKELAVKCVMTNPTVRNRNDVRGMSMMLIMLTHMYCMHEHEHMMLLHMMFEMKEAGNKTGRNRAERTTRPL